MENENKKEISLEQGFDSLDQITAKLEEPDLSLEERFELYKKGMDLIRICSEKIDVVEKKLAVIHEDGTVKEID